MKLDGKSIVIVGGTTGIGRAAAECFVNEGATVTAVGLDDSGVRAIVSDLGSEVRAIAGDARSPEVAVRAIDEALKRRGRLDGLYHVAGGSGRRMGDGPLHELTDEGWAYTLDLNLTSVMYSNRAAVRRFMEQGRGGAILNMSSVLAYSPSSGHFATHAYAAAKAGIIGFSKSIASYYAGYNIRVNILAPGLTATPMARRAAASEVILSFIRKKQPLDGGRMGLPDDLSTIAAYFMSDESRFVTGQVLAVDGGWSVTDGPSGEVMYE